MNKLEQFINDSIAVHGNKFDYSQVEYKNVDTKVLIICPDHGPFYQTPWYHKKGHQCKKCADIQGSSKTRVSKTEFLDRATKKYGNNYDYSAINYVNFKTNIDIVCLTHNVTFTTTPSTHLRSKVSCPQCALELRTSQRRMTKEDFIKVASITHQNKYDYSLITDSEMSSKKVTVICPCHGQFKQSRRDHIHAKSGCPKCRSSKGEDEIRKVLESYSINYIYQKTYPDLFVIHKRNKLRYDFYLPEFNLCIEYDGQQHFNPRDRSGKLNSNQISEMFDRVKLYDNLKTKYCETHNIGLLRIPYYEFHNIETIIKDRVGIE